jgi:2-hydroxychromene-2-carboxylate isomerase
MVRPAPRIDFWFEPASSYSYLSASRIRALAQRESVTVVYRPFLLGPIFKGQGWDDTPFNLYPAKGRYMWRDMQRRAARYGLTLRRPSTFPRNGLLAARVALVGVREPWGPRFVEGMYRASFAEDRDIGDETVIAALLRELGLAPEGILEDAVAPANKNALRAQTDEARELGIFGAPSFTVAGELFWGDDRLEDAIAWAQSIGGTF